MNRQLVVCLDGTGNRFSDRPTNVLRVVRSLAKHPEQVLAYYDQGVGTFGLKETLFEWQKVPARISGLAFGWGLKRVVENAYRFLAENHREGDEIHMFGFSRGAYTARALAAMVHAVGLVPAHATHLFDYAWAMLLARDEADGKPDFPLQARFKETFGRPVGIRFLGLFDTVKSVGWVYDPVVIPWTTNNPSVDFVRHAVSIDETRCFFRQHLWSPRPENTNVKEVWFAGVHSDVGGGYPPGQAQLAKLAHRWMLGEANSLGLHLDPLETEREQKAGATADCSASMHTSLAGPWLVAEWLPRLVWQDHYRRRSLEIGTVPPFRSPRPRPVPVGALVHRSVEDRLTSRDDYRPVNLPEPRTIVDDLPLPL